MSTLKKHEDLNVGSVVCDTGLLVKRLWQEVSDRHGMNLKITGLPSLATFQFDAEDPAPIMTLHVQNMLKQGFWHQTNFMQLMPILTSINISKRLINQCQ